MKKQVLKILLNDPFYGSMLLNLVLKAVPDMPHDAATDGIHIFYNPTYEKTATPSNKRTTLVHELLHCILLHIVRKGNRDHKLWNIACDYAVNAYIKHHTEYELTPDFLYDPKFIDMSAEQIYDILKRTKSEEEIAELYEQTTNSSGPMQDAPKPSAEDIAAGHIEIPLEEQWKSNVVQACNVAKSRGYNMGGLELLLEEILNPTLPWHVILLDLMQEQDVSDYSWLKPNLSMVYQDIYLPSAYSKSASALVLVYDTSCSVDEDELLVMQAETNFILEVVKPERIVVLHVDTDVRKVEEYTPQDLPVVLGFKGRGGTEFQPAFDYIHEHIEDIKCVIYFSDMGVGPNDYDDIDPYYPLYWVNTYDGSDAPIGTTLHINN